MAHPVKGAIIAAGEGDQDAASRAKEVAASLLEQASGPAGSIEKPSSGTRPRKRQARPAAKAA